MSKKFAVIGLGKFGTTIARTLAEKGAEVMAIDASEEKVEKISNDVAYAVQLDAKDEKALMANNIKHMDAVVVAIGSSFEACLLSSVTLLDLGIKRIISRYATEEQKMILEKVGINETLSPEDEVGYNVAQRLLDPDIITSLSLPDEYEIAEVIVPESFAGKKVNEVGIREKYDINLITIKRDIEEMQDEKVVKQVHIIGVPKGDSTFYKDDKLVIMGKRGDIKKFVEVNK